MSRGGPPGAVFDCMVFLQATARPTGPAARLVLDFVEGGRLTLYVSDAILDGSGRIRRSRHLDTAPMPALAKCPPMCHDG